MSQNQSVIGIFPEHPAAEAAVQKLAASGIMLKNLSVVGRGYHTEDTAFGFYNIGDRMRFWGTRGAFWGGLWGLLFGGVILAVPVVGHVVVLGYLATAVVSALEGAVVVGGISAVSAALFSVGIPHDSIVKYETEIKADRFLVLAHGEPDDIRRAGGILRELGALSVETHDGVDAGVPA